MPLGAARTTFTLAGAGFEEFDVDFLVIAGAGGGGGGSGEYGGGGFVRRGVVVHSHQV